MATQTQTQVPAGVIDPATGRMMTDDEVALHRAVGPDRSDPPGGSPPRGPFGGQGPPGGGFPGGGTPLGGGGFPGGGPPAGPPGGGGQPHAGPGGGGPRPPDKLVGNPPEIFTGIREKAEPFLTFWGIYAGVNRKCSIIANPYQKSLLFLTYIQGNDMAEWVQSMSRWLQRQVDQEGVDPRDPWLYNSTIISFRCQYADVLQEEKACALIMKGFKMDPQNPDNYISKFEELVRHAHLNINDPLTIGHFTKGLPQGLYETTYQFDSLITFEQWREATLRRQGQWFHMEAR